MSSKEVLERFDALINEMTKTNPDALSPKEKQEIQVMFIKNLQKQVQRLTVQSGVVK